MRLFRRLLPLAQASARPATVDDLAAIQYLFRSGGRRFIGFSPEDLPALLATVPAVVLTSGSEIWGVIVCGWPAHNTTWLRGVAFADGIVVGEGLTAMLPLLRSQLSALGLRAVYYAGDEAADRWLQPAFQSQGLLIDTEVVVYEKRDMSIPSVGNTLARVRSALAVDLRQILDLDELCFDDQWTKGSEILGPAISEVPFFVVAELNGIVRGYSFATSHFNGRLLHLVRIAVDPSIQGNQLGVRLLADLVSFAAHNQTEVITLNTQADNYRAQRLYRWFGFKPTGERQTILRYDVS